MATKGMKFHWHACDICAFVWRHSEKERSPEQNEMAHACPDCGAVLPEPYEAFDARGYFS